MTRKLLDPFACLFIWFVKIWICFRLYDLFLFWCVCLSFSVKPFVMGVIKKVLHNLRLVWTNNSERGFLWCAGRADLCGTHSLLSLSQLLHLVGFGLGGSLHSGDELLFRSDDFLLFDGDLLLPLNHLDFYFLQTDLLLLFGCLQHIRQLGFCFLERHKYIFNCCKHF